MKGTEHFKQVIKSYLDKRAESDELFRAKYETTTRTIEDIATYILNEVKASGCCEYNRPRQQVQLKKIIAVR